VRVDCRYFNDTLGHFSAIFNSEECVVRQQWDIFIVDSHYIFKDRIIPISIIMPRRKRIQKIVINVVGGPSNSIRLDSLGPAHRDFAVHLARKNLAYITVGYSGTFERSRFPEANLPLAIEEIDYLYEQLTARNDNVCFFGSSLGGYITLVTRKNANSLSLRNSRAVIYNPLVISGSQILAHSDRHPEAKRLLYHRFNSFELDESGQERFIGLRDELHREIFVSFFGNDIDDDPIGGDRSNVKVLYSVREPVLGEMNKAIGRQEFSENFESIDSADHRIPGGWKNYFVRRRMADSVYNFCFGAHPQR
jgi:hypothetical protein